MMARRFPFIVLLALCLRLPAAGQSATPALQPDTVHHSRPGSMKLALPVGLIAYGVLTVNHAHHLSAPNDELREEAQENFPHFHTTLDNYTRYLPGGIAVGLTALGVPGRRPLVPLLLTYELAHVLNAQVTNNLKHLAHEARPDVSSDFSSFPSAHTSEAFMAATLLYEQYGHEHPWLGVGGFTLATATGAMRVLNGRHWLSDVATGAGIGILSAEAVWQLYPWLAQKLPGKVSHRLLLLPAYAPGGAAVLVAFQPYSNRK